MQTLGNIALGLASAFYLYVIIYIIRYVPSPWPHLAAWLRNGGKKDILSVFILIIGMIALWKLLWVLDASGLNHVSR